MTIYLNKVDRNDLLNLNRSIGNKLNLEQEKILRNRLNDFVDRDGKYIKFSIDKHSFAVRKAARGLYYTEIVGEIK